MTQEAKYQRMVLTHGFVQVTESGDSTTFFPQITFYEKNEGKYLLTVETDDDTAALFLNALQLMVVPNINTVLQGERKMVSMKSNGRMYDLWFKNSELLIVKAGESAKHDDALVVISTEEVPALISSIVALH
jgi:hypothetical protein